jgi:hypothetical protein
MPYQPNSKDLPSYVKNRSESVKKKWISIFNSVYAKEGEKVAFIVANKWLKDKVVEKKTVARTSETLERVELVIDETVEFLSRTEDGEDYISFKLADNQVDSKGVQLPEEILKKWADEINSGKILLGDIDHESWQSLLGAGLSEDQIKKEIQNKPSIAKAVRAVFEKGRLWVRAIIDKRYKKLIKGSKGVSMEAIIKRRNSDNKVFDGHLAGFTFGIKQTPVIQGTEVYA